MKLIPVINAVFSYILIITLPFILSHYILINFNNFIGYLFLYIFLYLIPSTISNIRYSESEYNEDLIFRDLFHSVLSIIVLGFLHLLLWGSKSSIETFIYFYGILCNISTTVRIGMHH